MLQEVSLPYHVEKKWLFLKDAAEVSGRGVMGRSSLLLHPEWGPRIRRPRVLATGEAKGRADPRRRS